MDGGWWVLKRKEKCWDGGGWVVEERIDVGMKVREEGERMVVGMGGGWGKG